MGNCQRAGVGGRFECGMGAEARADMGHWRFGRSILHRVRIGRRGKVSFSFALSRRSYSARNDDPLPLQLPHQTHPQSNAIILKPHNPPSLKSAKCFLLGGRFCRKNPGPGARRNTLKADKHGYAEPDKTAATSPKHVLDVPANQRFYCFWGEEDIDE